MKISVVIPTHNRKQLLTRALDSLVQQTFTDFECIVHDNFSDDGTENYLKDWINKNQPKFPIHYFKTNEKIPILENWQRAIEKAQFNYIKILWDDDWLENNALAVYSDTIIKNDADGVVSAAQIVKNNKNIRFYVSDLNNEVLRKEDVVKSMFAFEKFLPYSPSASLIKKELISEAFKTFDYLGFCREKVIGIDFLINYIGVFKNKKIVKINNTLSFLDASEDSITENTLSRNLGMCYFSALFKACEDCNYNLDTKRLNILKFVSLYKKFSKQNGFYLPKASINKDGIFYVFRYLIFKIKQKINQ